jgi:hypothetical protein
MLLLFADQDCDGLWQGRSTLSSSSSNVLQHQQTVADTKLFANRVRAGLQKGKGTLSSSSSSSSNVLQHQQRRQQSKVDTELYVCQLQQ